MNKTFALSGLFLCLATAASAAEPDILIADFEGPTYGDWRVEGAAFGSGPAAGTLPQQMQVSGFEGQRLVNSFFQGDGTTGTLTSPPLTIQRPIGGGGDPQPASICWSTIKLRTATGPYQPGGSEALDALLGVSDRRHQGYDRDQATGGWGQSDQLRRTGRACARAAGRPAASASAGQEWGTQADHATAGR